MYLATTTSTWRGWPRPARSARRVFSGDQSLMARAQTERTLRGRVAVVGIGETEYYRHGASPDPEFKLALKAILAACNDAGIDPREIDGFSLLQR